MKLKATGIKDGFWASLVFTGDILPFNIKLIDSVKDSVLDQWRDELFELSTTEFCFSGAIESSNDDPFKLLWIIDSFFDEKPIIDADFDVKEYTEEIDSSVVY